MKLLLVQNAGIDPNISGFDGQPHVAESLFGDFAEMIDYLKTGNDNFWTYQVLALTFMDDRVPSQKGRVVGFEDVTQNVANVLAAASWDLANEGVLVHPLALRAEDTSLADYIEHQAMFDAVKENCGNRTISNDFLARCEANGVSV